MSPGEPFHFKEAGADWLINWYMVRENGRALLGPDPKTLIEPISKEEFIHAVQIQTKDWSEWVYHMHTRKSQAYAILTMCRALYASTHGEQVSKRQAAVWAEQELPEWSQVIKQALVWREAWRDEAVDHDATFPETQRFVQFIVDKVAS